jgi:hypothetical protein
MVTAHNVIVIDECVVVVKVKVKVKVKEKERTYMILEEKDISYVGNRSMISVFCSFGYMNPILQKVT